MYNYSIFSRREKMLVATGFNPLQKASDRFVLVRKFASLCKFRNKTL